LYNKPMKYNDNYSHARTVILFGRDLLLFLRKKNTYSKWLRNRKSIPKRNLFFLKKK
jgi:phage anti-repressor protein